MLHGRFMPKPFAGLGNAVPAALLISPEPPYPAVGGGALRTASIIEYLSRRYNLDLIVFRDPDGHDPAACIPQGLARSVYTVDLPRHSRNPFARVCRNLVRWVRARPPLNDRFWGFSSQVSAVVEGKRYHLAVVEHFWCAPYIDQLSAQCSRVILDLHNIESALLAGYERTEPWPVRRIFRRFRSACQSMESYWLPRFHHLLVASDEDRKRVHLLAPGCSASVYPNALPVIQRPQLEEENVIAFSGNLAYPPNISAIRFFRTRVWPLLRDRWPGLIWRVIGKNPEAVRKFINGDQRIELTGPVEDAVQALATAKVVVVPILAGSGTRIKILEAWAAARAVVSTGEGAEGLPGRDGEHLLLARSPKDFTEAVSSLLESPHKRRELGQAGRTMYEHQFTWESAWATLERNGI